MWSEDEVSVGHETASTGDDIPLQVVSVGQRDGVQVGVPTSVSFQNRKYEFQDYQS